MKKVMMVIAALALAFGVQAASMDWKVTVNTADRGMQFMFFNADNQTAVLAALEAGGADVYDTVAALAYSADSVKQFATTAKTSAKTGGLSDITKGDSVFVVVFGTKTAGSLTDGTTYSYTSAVAPGSYIYDAKADPPESSPGTFNISATSFAGTGTIGQGGAVPEPTSGLLLLLGGAMLTLRRKQK